MSLRANIKRQLADGPLTVKQLRARLHVDGKKITKALKSLADDGLIVANRQLYSLPQQMDGQSAVLDGRVVKLAAGFGFVSPLDGSEDVFIPGRGLNAALPGDVVEVVLRAHPRVAGSREGEIVQIKQPRDILTGTVDEKDGRLVLRPDFAPEMSLIIRRTATGGAVAGEKAACQVLRRDDNYSYFRLGVIQRFGMADFAKQCVKSILYANGIEKNFTAEVKAEAKMVAAKPIDEHGIRADFRDRVIFTIDSASTKDIDDAISAKKTKNGYVLGVHIADVSDYVRAGTKLDDEAFARGTSIYYADSVIPMLPKALSNGACSLNPEEDRHAFSCTMELDTQGHLQEFWFEKTIIRSCVKGVYDEVNRIFAGEADAAIGQKYAMVLQSLSVMQELYGKLATLRKQRDALDIESDEPELTIDAEGRCVDVQKRARGDAERMIEEFMLLANGAAARFAKQYDLPFVYRVHDKPSGEKVHQLKTVLTALGVETTFQDDAPTQRELEALLDKVRGSNMESPVHMAVLRSMAKAKYDIQPVGHYGLALADYAHFTSPIRRYPDLAIHRIMSKIVLGAPDEEVRRQYRKFAERAAIQSSERELVAQQIERDCDDCYKAEYMKQFIGQVFEGTVVSVVPYGLYIALSNTVEGLLRASALSEHRLELREGVALYEPYSGQEYRVGGVLQVRVAAVDVSQGNVDFVLPDAIIDLKS